MIGYNLKCPTCKRKIQYQNEHGLVITKNSIIESDPESGGTHAICKFCKEKVFVENLRLVAFTTGQ
jgi:hypothetical protein